MILYRPITLKYYVIYCHPSFPDACVQVVRSTQTAYRIYSEADDQLSSSVILIIIYRHLINRVMYAGLDTELTCFPGILCRVHLLCMTISDDPLSSIDSADE